MASCTGSACRHATNPGCRCGCGGGNHGALTRIGWAIALATPRGVRGPVQATTVAAALQAQLKATASIKRQQGSLRPKPAKPRSADATAFFEATRTVEVVTWLVEHSTEREQIDWLAEQVAGACTQALAAHPGTHIRFADHFWCDVLAALVTVLEDFTRAVDDIPAELARLLPTADIGSRAWQAVRASRGESYGNRPNTRAASSTFHRRTRTDRDHDAGLSDAALRAVVEQLITLILAGPTAATIHLTLDPLILQLRVLAVLLCPDPYAHQVVWDHCVLPLLRTGIVIDTTHFLTRFVALFQRSWPWPR